MSSPYGCGQDPLGVFRRPATSSSDEVTLRVGRVLARRAKAHLILASEDVWLMEVLSVLAGQKVRG